MISLSGFSPKILESELLRNASTINIAHKFSLQNSKLSINVSICLYLYIHISLKASSCSAVDPVQNVFQLSEEAGGKTADVIRLS